jgi:hypothetical protein
MQERNIVVSVLLRFPTELDAKGFGGCKEAMMEDWTDTYRIYKWLVQTCGVWMTAITILSWIENPSFNGNGKSANCNCRLHNVEHDYKLNCRSQT